MSPRKKILRKVLNLPVIKGFKPYGPEVEEENKELVNLFYEEYEALRLSDYDNLNHLQASVLMGISRPTFTRIYALAVQKIAKAFVEGRQISIEGGKVYFDSDWYHCKCCKCNFNNPEKNIEIKNCPLCGKEKIIRYDFENEIKFNRKNNCNFVYICPDCGYEQTQHSELSCNQLVCPHCNSVLKIKMEILNIQN